MCIDESMIKYMGRAIAFIQYMPNKPIKHGIKAFMCTCKDHPLQWEIYLGKDVAEIDSSAHAVVLRLITMAGLTTQSGRYLFTDNTDNWYTSFRLAKTLFVQFNWLFVGTNAPTKKKGRVGYDIPFHQFSKKALKSVVRGWSRHATTPIKGKR